MSDKHTTVSVSALSFFSVWMILTLNADNGKDILDELVPWVAAQTQATLKETKEDES